MSIKIFGCTFGREELYLSKNKNRQGIRPVSEALNGLRIDRCEEGIQKTSQGYFSTLNGLKIIGSAGRKVHLP